MRYLDQFPQKQYYHRPYWVDDPYTENSTSNPQLMKHVLSHYLKDQEGELDIDKVFDTVGSVVQTAQEIRPFVKNVQRMAKNLK